MSSSHIIPECWADNLLAITLGYSSPNHQFGVGQVNNIMNKDLKNKVAIGIVDNDKNQPSDFKKFKELKNAHDLTLKKRPGTKHYLIMVSPAVDKWIETVGNSVNVARPYRNNDKEYRKQMKSIDVDDNKQIKAYFNTIKQKNPAAFKTIKNWISSILEGEI
ncbi:MAG: hypothetical protein ACLQQ4_09100 [Bacteroidia bacterium]